MTIPPLAPRDTERFYFYRSYGGQYNGTGWAITSTGDVWWVGLSRLHPSSRFTSEADLLKRYSDSAVVGYPGPSDFTVPEGL